ncbi:hypothetical protein EDM57_17060 [Brevibacillus gelatini]|uniref:DUF4097 domain-containing protein n=1 Tax=Brevibacillus gelatini TaxID=1655277 RepID=A0A3M8AUR9_9BACL|nr:DUF4097 family beta strand repeat-containing protein [Brevibacillus gelatini]RNB54377.1 hypothetical protein EDM57_17060 [Brevibacillus gelatini]
MKNWGRKLFGLSLLLFVVGVCGLIWLFARQEHFVFSLKKLEDVRVIEQPFKAVSIETATADLVITPTKTAQATVRLTGEISEQHKERLQLTSEVTEDGTLRVQLQEKLFVSLFYPGSEDLRLEIMLPEKEYESIRLETATGDIKSGVLTAKTGKVSSGAGDVDLTGYAGERLDVRTDTGDLKLAGIRATLNVYSSTGEIDKLVLPELTQDVTVRTDTGDVRIEVEKLPEAAQLELASDVGDIEVQWANLSFAKREEQNIKASVGTGGPKLAVKSSTGDIRIQ